MSHILQAEVESHFLQLQVNGPYFYFYGFLL